MRAFLFVATAALAPAWIVAGSGSASAAEMSCSNEGVLKENRPARMWVLCAGYDQAYYVGNEVKPASVTLLVRPRTGSGRQVTIPNPGLPMSSCFSPGESRELQQLLARQGVSAGGAQVSLASVSLDAATPLYRDPGKAVQAQAPGAPRPPSGPAGPQVAPTPSGPGGQQGAANPPPAAPARKPVCRYVRLPRVISTEGCGNNRMCTGMIDCGGGVGQAVCLASGPDHWECPSADDCAAEKGKVVFQQPRNSAALFAPRADGSASGRDGQ